MIMFIRILIANICIHIHDLAKKALMKILKMENIFSYQNVAKFYQY
jgi:hypothetical protein